jgi:class 3 adenylate cyclase
MMLDQANRTFICSVVFVDLVGYSKKSVAEQITLKDRFTGLLSESLKNIAVNDRIILDTGDGAAMSFLGDPEDALFVAMNLRDALKDAASSGDGAAGRDEDGKGLICIGINLGPVKLIKDINGHPNIIGDGINVAQRIMSFAKPGQIVVSRSYYDVVSCLSEEYAKLFHYEGSRTDKHVREHEVYLVGESESAFKEAKSGMEHRAAQTNPRGRAKGNGAEVRTGTFDFITAAGNGSFAGFLHNRKKIMIAGSVLGAVVLLLTLLLLFKRPAPPPAASTAVSSAPATLTHGGPEKIEPAPAAPATGFPDAPGATTAHAPAGTPATDASKPKEAAKPAPAPASTPGNAASPVQPAAAKADATKTEQPRQELLPGTVTLFITPWGEVLVDGKLRGVSPPVKTFKLPPGKHKIEIRNTTFPPHSEALDIKSREVTAVRHKFQ